MANAKAARSRQWPRLLAVVALLLAGAWWFFGDSVRAYAQAGTAYGVKNACSCRYISGRSLDSCETDFLSRMHMIWLTEDEAEQSVTARVPLIESTTATYDEDYGCVLEPWEG